MLHRSEVQRQPACCDLHAGSPFLMMEAISVANAAREEQPAAQGAGLVGLGQERL